MRPFDSKQESWMRIGMPLEDCITESRFAGPTVRRSIIMTTRLGTCSILSKVRPKVEVYVSTVSSSSAKRLRMGPWLLRKFEPWNSPSMSY